MSGREEPRAVINGLSGRSFHKDSTGISKILLFSAVISIGFERERKGWRGGKKTHASSPSTSGKTHEKTCPIQTRLKTATSKPNHRTHGLFTASSKLLGMVFPEIFLS